MAAIRTDGWHCLGLCWRRTDGLRTDGSHQLAPSVLTGGTIPGGCLCLAD